MDLDGDFVMVRFKNNTFFLSLKQSGEDGGDRATERYLTWADLACPLSVEPAFLLPL